MKIKYIHFEDIGFVLFEEQIDHSRLASLIKDTVISAGFVNLPNEDTYGNKASCYGESVSLNIKSKEADTTRLQRVLNPYT
jgi:hypothetical protein